MSRTSLRRRAVQLLDTAFSIVLPPVCVSCKKAGDLFCPACRADLAWIQPPVCVHCGRRLRGGECRACRRLSPAVRLRAAVWFSGPIIQAIHQFKYNGITAAAKPLSELMLSSWQQWALPAELVVPVALHPQRERERGYNQAALLARQLSDRLSLPLAEHALVRTRVTRPQVGLSAGERVRNVSGAFQADATLVAGRQILLVDDVCTTGATLKAAAEALLEGGASGVSAYCVARADSG